MRSSAHACVALFLLAGCTTYHDQLGRAERAFEVNEHDKTLASLRDLEPDLSHLTAAEQAEYAYIRGMTDYRVGYRPDARHWLSIAKAYEDHAPGMLPAEWKKSMTDALEELNNSVYANGLASLTSTRTK